MAKNVLVPIAQGTADMEAVIIIEMLRRAKLNVVVAGETNIITCARDVKIIPEKYFSDIENDEIWDAIVIPGGRQAMEELGACGAFTDILAAHNDREGIIGAICAAPVLLHDLRILPKGVKVTAYPTMKSAFVDEQYSEYPVVVSGRFITSRSAGTTIDFCLQLIEILADTETADRVKQEICYDK
ncbi:MAG: DJ-1/PfpI family protein [Candidatus Kapabacteria bacterium]|nr:DJ-1/PfpI family protein [Candidatus Kapabacteria bacterium]